MLKFDGIIWLLLILGSSHVSVVMMISGFKLSIAFSIWCCLFLMDWQFMFNIRSGVKCFLLFAILFFLSYHLLFHGWYWYSFEVCRWVVTVGENWELIWYLDCCWWKAYIAVVWISIYNTVPSYWSAFIYHYALCSTMNILTSYVVPLVAGITNHCSIVPCDWFITCSVHICGTVICHWSRVCTYVISRIIARFCSLKLVDGDGVLHRTLIEFEKSDQIFLDR